MNKVMLFFYLFSLSLFVSCEIVQETRFNKNGSGNYSLGLDFSEMMKMGPKKDSIPEKAVDTTIAFGKLLEEYKDSIATLSKKEQLKLKALEQFQLHINTDPKQQKATMKIDYDFKDIKDLMLFGNKLKDQDIKELQALSSKINVSKKKTEIPDFNEGYDITFNKKSFAIKITKEGLKKAEKEKDTTLTANNPMAEMIRFKSRYIFPFRIKEISNKNARILSDFKGYEIDANFFEINNNPKFLDTKVTFE